MDEELEEDFEGAEVLQPTRLSRVLAAVCIAWSLYWFWATLVSPIRGFLGREEGEADLSIFFFFLCPVLALPGVLLLVWGVRLWRELSGSNVKRVLVLLLVFFAFVLGAVLTQEIVGRTQWDWTSAFEFCLLLSSLLALALYVFGGPVLFRRLGLPAVRMRRFLGKGFCFVVAIQSYLLLSVAWALAFPEPEERNAAVMLSDLRFIVPFGLAWLMYKLLVGRVVRKGQFE